MPRRTSHSAGEVPARADTEIARYHRDDLVGAAAGHVTSPKGGRLRYVPMTARLASALQGETCSKHRVARLMREANLRALHGYLVRRWSVRRGVLTERALVGIGCDRSRGVKSEMSAKEACLRTSAQRKKRSVVYRILNVVFILVGVVHLAMTAMNRGATDFATYVLQMDISMLWLVIAGMWVAFSRIWGELSEEAAARK